MKENNICGTGCGCSEKSTAGFEEKRAARQRANKEINIEFLYLDLEVCEQCQGSENNLEEALNEVSTMLASAGVKANLKKIHIESFEQAQALQFISSPTIRINGQDVQFEVKENYCSSCSALSGDETYCRVWNFGGEEFSDAPKPLVIEAILKEVYGASENGGGKGKTSPEQLAQSLDNLKRFFEGRRIRENTFRLKSETLELTNLPKTAEQTATAGGCGC